MGTYALKQVREFLWKFLVTFLLYLSYFAEGRSYVETNFGQYVTGFMDGVVVSISFFVLALYLRKEKKEN